MARGEDYEPLHLDEILQLFEYNMVLKQHNDLDTITGSVSKRSSVYKDTDSLDSLNLSYHASFRRRVHHAVNDDDGDDDISADFVTDNESTSDHHDDGTRSRDSSDLTTTADNNSEKHATPTRLSLLSFFNEEHDEEPPRQDISTVTDDGDNDGDIDDDIDADNVDVDDDSHGTAHVSTCEICFDEFGATMNQSCCGLCLCLDCFKSYVEIEVAEVRLNIECPGAHCRERLPLGTILEHLSSESHAKYKEFLKSMDPNEKKCPRCSTEKEIVSWLLEEKGVDRIGLKVTCVDCLLVWCFLCQAPWHGSMNCADYRQGDKLMKKWANRSQGLARGSKNAVPCPKCKVSLINKMTKWLC